MINVDPPDSPNILFMKYEDMKKDLPEAVRKVAEFMGVTLTPNLTKTIANQADFDYMKESVGVLEVMKKSRKPGGTDFFRKGIVGDWRSLFSEEQSARMDVIYDKKLAGTGLEFDFG